MAGPTVGVLVPVSAAALEDAILASVAEVGGRCKLETTSRLRFRDEADLPYGVEVEAWPSEDWTHASAEDTAAAIGFRPDREVVLIAFVNDGTSHRLPGQLAVDLATKTGGWIDLGGALTPASNTSRDLSIPEVHEYVRGLGLPGRVQPIGYEIDAERLWLTHVLDVEALTAWLTHRDFHLIK